MGRKAARATVLALLTSLKGTDAGDLVEVYDHETKDFARLSPVAMINSDGTNPVLTFTEQEFRFNIWLWIRRDDDAATEDAIDDLCDRLMDVILGAANIRFVETFSELDYPTVDGVQYRRERIGVIVS